VSISAKEGKGMADLTALVEQLFIDGALDLRSDAVLTNARQYAAAIKALRLLEAATESLRAGFPVDVCCSDAEGAMEALAELDGRAVSEDLVSEIFSHFCVGK
jgi:tRNA modification GTPase